MEPELLGDWCRLCAKCTLITILNLTPRVFAPARTQVELMQIDTTASDDLPGFRMLGISPRSLEEELEAMLKQSK